MSSEKKTMSLKERILDGKNIYNAIYCMESYVFDRGLLNTEEKITLYDVAGKAKKEIPNDLVLFHLLHDKFNMELIDCVIETCKKRLMAVLDPEKKELFDVQVYFKLKKLDDQTLKFRPLHTARLIDLICMVSILNLLMFEDDTHSCKRRLSDLSKLIPHNFYGNIPSTDPQYLFHKWQSKYKEYSNNVIEHCLQYQKNHKYQTEVSLDIVNFFPSISPKLLFRFIVQKLSILYRDSEDLETLKTAVVKLLYFNLDKKNIAPWKEEYYGESKDITDDFYMNCGIPQGLPQSYFFGNLCMLKVEFFLMDKDCFKGDAYFYVDDSVIYVQSKYNQDEEKGINEFNSRIQTLNRKLQEWCRAENAKDDSRDRELQKFLSKDCLDFQEKLNYTIRFHEDGKSTCMHVDDIDTLTELIMDVNRQTYDMGSLARNMDELDDQVSLGKLNALDEVIDVEIGSLKGDEKSDNKQKSSTAKSRLVLLRRFKKFFLYRLRLLKMRNDGGLVAEDIDSFKERFHLEDGDPKRWFEQVDEDIFQTEYQLIIQNMSKNEAGRFCNGIAEWERKVLAWGKMEDLDRYDSLFFAKDAHNAYLMKSLSQDTYASLRVWVKENFHDIKNSSSDKQLGIFRKFLSGAHQPINWPHMMEKGFEEKEFTRFVLNASADYQRRILNVYFSEIVGVQASDAITFVKESVRKSCYTELRILAYLRNRHFDSAQFLDFIKYIDEHDLSNSMGIDMELLQVLGFFITRVRHPEWVDALICTHRLTKGLWYNGSKFLNSYTLHNEEHAVTLIRKSLELMNRIDFFTLKQVDYYILFLSCYLHDISMVIHPDLGKLSADSPKNMSFISALMLEMDKQVQHFMKVDETDTKNARMKDGGKFLVDVFNQVYEYFESTTRDNHAKDSAKFVLGRADDLLSYLEPTILSFVAKVSESHGYDVDDVYGLKSKAKEDTVSLKYMMILIRMADLLDVANDRVNYHLLRQNLKHLSPTSRFHWISHLVTDKVELRTEYQVNDSYIAEKKNKRSGKKQPEKMKPIREIINLDLVLNFKQLTAYSNDTPCNFCKCAMMDDYMRIGIYSGHSHVQCPLKDCPVLCKWMVKKHEWLIHELVALNDYLYSVNDYLFDTRINFNIHYKNEMKLDADMFDEIKKYIS